MNTSALPSAPLAAACLASQPYATHDRRPELDWLRTIIVLGIIPYHALLLFGTLGVTVSVIDTWGISLIFLLAGAASWFALEVRSPRTYVVERLTRLLIPAALVVLVFTPIDAYFLASMNPAPGANPAQLGSLGEFFLRYWRSILIPGSPTVVRNVLGHLWFVPRLLIVSLLCLPLLLFLRNQRLSWTDRLARSRLSANVLVLAAGLAPAAAVTVLRPGWLHRLTAFLPLADDWTIVSLDLILFVYGFLLYSNPRLLDAVRRLAYPTLAASLVSWAIILPIMLRGIAPANDYSPPYLIFSMGQIFAMWLLTLAVLGLALRYLAVAPVWQPYLTTATFPIYVLHLPLLIVTTYYLKALPLPSFVQLVLAIIVTLASAFALYEFVVRRAPVIRFLFGLEKRRPAQEASVGGQ